MTPDTPQAIRTIAAADDLDNPVIQALVEEVDRLKAFEEAVASYLWYHPTPCSRCDWLDNVEKHSPRITKLKLPRHGVSSDA